MVRENVATPRKIAAARVSASTNAPHARVRVRRGPLNGRAHALRAFATSEARSVAASTPRQHACRVGLTEIAEMRGIDVEPLLCAAKSGVERTVHIEPPAVEIEEGNVCQRAGDVRRI